MEPPPAPGALILERLARRGWSQGDLADVLDRPAQWVSTVVNGRKEITRESAAQLAAALGTTPEYWLEAQDTYRLYFLDQSPAHLARLDAIRRRAGQAAERPVIRLDPKDFPGLTAGQVAKLERMARQMGREIARGNATGPGIS